MSAGEFEDSAAPSGPDLWRGLGLGGTWVYKIQQSTVENIESLGYRIDGAELGRGSFSIVLRAQHQESGRFVAIKVILDANSPHALRQYQREVWMLNSEDLPYGIAPICYHNAQGTSGQPFMVLEYIDGEKIHEFVMRRRLSVPQRTKIVEQLFLAYAGLHKSQWIHGDPSPNNALVDRRGLIRVIDFGNCRRIAADGSVAAEGEECSGTPSFAPSEQVAGTQPASVASDLFGVAALSYLVFTGETLPEEYRRDSKKLHLKLMDVGVPSWMIRIVAKALRAPDVVPGLSEDDHGAFHSFADVQAAIQSANRRSSSGVAVLARLLSVCLILGTLGGIAWRWKAIETASGIEERRAMQAAIVDQLQQTIIWLKESGHDAAEEDSLSRLERERDRWLNIDMARISSKEMQIYQHYCLQLVQDSITQEQRECIGRPNVELIDECIEHIPWVKVSSYVMQELASTQKKAKNLSKRLNAGAVTGDHEELVILGNQMRELIRLNRRAVSAKLIWDSYHSNLETISLRLRQLPEFGEVDSLDREGDAAWEMGDFDLAEAKYQQALHALDLFLAMHESSAENAARMAMLAQSDFRAISRGSEQLSQMKLERDQLAEQVRELQEQCQLFREFLANLIGPSSASLLPAEDEFGTQASSKSLPGRNSGDEAPP